MLAKKYADRVLKLWPMSDEATVKKLICEIEHDGNPTPQTQLVRLSQLKRFFKENRPEWTQYVTFDPNLLSAVESLRKKTLERRNNLVVSYDHISRILYWGIADRKNWPKLIAFLQLTSGRRISEICECSFIYHSRDTVGCSDLHKKQRKHYHTFHIHSISALKWLELVRFVQEIACNYTVNTITRRVNRSLKRALNTDEITSHKMRGIYANLMYIKSGKQQMHVGFIKDVLCLDSVDVALHYSSYKFV